MAQVTSTQEIVINSSADRVLAALTDYVQTRPKILSSHYVNYTVIEGGEGAGTKASWTLNATEKRSRNVLATVAVEGDTITETDANSSMVTTYTVVSTGAAATTSTTTSWNGAGGIGGFFEKTFAPLGLKKIQAEVLGNLKKLVEES